MKGKGIPDNLINGNRRKDMPGNLINEKIYPVT